MPSAAPFRVIQRFPRDLRHALRRLRSSPWYATTVVGTTALTMVLATAAFTVVDGVLFKPLPYERAGELFRVSGGYSEELRAANPRGARNRSGLAMGVLDARELEAAVPGVRVALHSAASRPARLAICVPGRLPSRLSISGSSTCWASGRRSAASRTTTSKPRPKPCRRP
jgi:hypothetical protein